MVGVAPIVVDTGTTYSVVTYDGDSVTYDVFVWGIVPGPAYPWKVCVRDTLWLETCSPTVIISPWP